MPDQDTWRFINTFAPWVSGIGSLAASTVALYLARRQRRVHLHVYFTVRIQMDPETPHATSPRFAYIDVTNRGARRAVVHSVGFSFGWLRKKEFILPALEGPQLPVKLEDGDTVSFRTPLNQFALAVVGSLSPRTILRSPWFRGFSLRALVGTTAGKAASGRAQKHVRLELHKTSREVCQHRAGGRLTPRCSGQR